ncbi:MAG TPA: hypothetical protein VK654_15930 [Nitrospirota bacterium]|nr:hypothetical protein [Nitrospirota bacterium]
MALKKGQTDIDLKKKSIVLLSVKTVNNYEPTYQIDLLAVIICPQSESCTNPRPYLYKANGAYKFETNRFNEYLVSLELVPGIYSFHSIGLMYQSFFYNAGGYTPLGLPLEIKPNTISYVGHMDVVLRKKKSEKEQTAGRETLDVAPVVQVELKNKSIAGFSTGTVDIIIEDRFSDDMKLFAAEYPALQKAQVEKAVLPPWKRLEDQGNK